jgi:hypothetical protein
MHGSTEIDILDTNHKCKSVHEPFAEVVEYLQGGNLAKRGVEGDEETLDFEGLRARARERTKREQGGKSVQKWIRWLQSGGRWAKTASIYIARTAIKAEADMVRHD